MRKVFCLILLIITIVVPVLALAQDGTLSKANGGGSVLLLKDISNGPDPSEGNQVCMAEDGTKITILDKAPYMKIQNFWLKIQAHNGSCEGKEGWVAQENVKLK
jgi:hypothetical protein